MGMAGAAMRQNPGDLAEVEVPLGGAAQLGSFSSALGIVLVIVCVCNKAVGVLIWRCLFSTPPAVVCGARDVRCVCGLQVCHHSNPPQF